MGDSSQFCENGKFSEIANFYLDVRERVIAAERVEKNNNLSITAISELRNALDHLMRAKAAEIGTIKGTALGGMPVEEYVDKNLDKALGHLYRTSYDSYDIISIELTDRITTIMDSVSRGTLYKVIPNAGETIVAPFNQAINTLKKAKTNKDLESPEGRGRYFAEYESATTILANILESLEGVESELHRVEVEREKDDAKSQGFQWKVAIISALIGSIFAAIIAFAIGSGGNSPR